MQCQFGGNIIANDSTIWHKQTLNPKDTLLRDEDIFSGLTPEGKENLCSNCLETKLWPPGRLNILFKESLITATFAFVCRMFVIYQKKSLKYLLLWSHASPTRSTHHPPSWCSVPAKRKYRYLMLSSCLSYFREHPFGIHLQIVDGQTWTDYLDFSCAE